MEYKKIFTVSDLNRYVKNMLEDDPRLANLWVKGEISNFKVHSSGHIYFVLKDQGGSLRAVMFSRRASTLVFAPQSGMKVIVRGYLSLYERDGTYQVYVEEIQPDGVGSLHLALEQLKAKLEKEGLFRSERKRSLPRIPGKIGVVTSPTGAAWQDLQKVIFSRYPNAYLVLAPSLVQGENAPREIAAGIERLNRVSGVNVIIVGRGGGSLEELWAFNSELVARAIYASRVPVISAVGHETDFTIADLVADRRAATPSAAGEMVVPVKRELHQLIETYHSRLSNAFETKINYKKQQVLNLEKSSVLQHPERILQNRKQALDLLSAALERTIQLKMQERRHQLQLLAEKIQTLSPLTTLARGFSYCRKIKGHQVITSPSQLQPEEKIEVIVAQGGFSCRVIDIWEDDIKYGKKD